VHVLLSLPVVSQETHALANVRGQQRRPQQKKQQKLLLLHLSQHFRVPN